MRRLPYKKIAIGLVITQIYCNSGMAQAAQDDITIVPDGISNVMSDIDMTVRLVAWPNATPCLGENCSENKAFDLRVKQLGLQLTDTAYKAYPTLQKRVPEFTFNVIDKSGLGSASNGGGKVVIFRGLQQLELDDETLGFIIAREMGHIIGRHHSKNTSTKLIISALASVLFPAVAIIGASSAAAQATSATTLLTSAASTATSLVGSEVAIHKMKPSQLVESDEIAVALMNQQNWNMLSVVSILQFNKIEQTSWVKDLQASTDYLQKIVDKEDAEIVSIEENYSEVSVNEILINSAQ